MKNVGLLALLAVFIIGFVAATGVSAFGRGNAEIREAIEKEDYEAFKEAAPSECEERQSLQKFRLILQYPPYPRH